MTDDTRPAWQCPKDGTAMEPMGRRKRSGAWRCPRCRAVFLDTEAMRRGRSGRGGRPPKWSPVVTSVLVSLLVTFVVRRLKRRRAAAVPPS